MSFESELREALRREPAPADFAAKVIARARAGSGSRPRGLLTLALAAALALAAVIPPVVSEYRRRERGLEARAQLETALAIARDQLRQVNEKVQRNTRRAL